MNLCLFFGGGAIHLFSFLESYGECGCNIFVMMVILDPKSVKEVNNGEDLRGWVQGKH